MPNHLHLLIAGESAEADCRRFIVSAKQYSRYYFARAFGTRLWQRYGFERVLRVEEQSRIVARYILENPIRAGLAASMDDYPFSGSFICGVRDLMEFVSRDSGPCGKCPAG